MLQIKRKQIDPQALAYNELIESQDGINVKAEECADVDSSLANDEQDIRDHNASHPYHRSDEAGAVAFYWVMAFFFFLLCFVDVVFIGLSATANLLRAVVLPLTFLVGETLLLCRLAYKLIELGGMEWPVNMSTIKKEDLGPRSEYGTLNLIKNVVVVLFGLWAFILMVDSHRYEMMVEQMVASEEAILSGSTPEYARIGFFEAAIDDILPWIYGCVALFIHWVYTRFQTMIFLTVSYVFGYRGKYRRLTGTIREKQRKRLATLSEIGARYNRYLSDKSEAEHKYSGFKAPEEFISPTARKYIAEYRGGYDDLEGTGNGQAVPTRPVITPTNHN